MAAGQVTETIGLSTAATTALVDRLEQKGFVRLARDGADRRKVVVVMTDVGHRWVNDIYGPLALAGARMLERYSDRQLSLIRDILESSRAITDRHRAYLQGVPDPEHPYSIAWM